MSEWLDLELSHHLAAVPAPEALWDRIQRGAEGRPSGSPALPRKTWHLALNAWPVAAILTLMAAAGTLWLVAKGEEPALNLRQLAIEQLRNPEPMALQSSDPREISAWMRQAGLEVTLPTARTGSVRLVGARIFHKRGSRIAAISYRVGGDNAMILVARAGGASDTGHGQLSWRSRGQSYAIAYSNPEHAEAACLLCHTAL